MISDGKNERKRKGEKGRKGFYPSNEMEEVAEEIEGPAVEVTAARQQQQQGGGGGCFPVAQRRRREGEETQKRENSGELERC